MNKDADLEAGDLKEKGKPGELSESAEARSDKLRQWPVSDIGIAVVCFVSGFAGGILLVMGYDMGWGFLFCFVALAYALKKVRDAAVAEDLWDSVAQLQEENDELSNSNKELERSVTLLEILKDDIEKTLILEKIQLVELREITDLVGEKGDAMVGKLKEMYEDYKSENARQQQQNDRQEQLQNQDVLFHVYRLMSNFDADTSGTLSDEEVEKTCGYLTNMYPNFDMVAFKAKLANLKLSSQRDSLKIKDVTDLIAAVVNAPP